MDLSQVDRISTAGIARRGDTYFVALRVAGTSIGESWEFPGGKNRKDERPEETLVREFCEEFSVEISVGELVFEGYFVNKGKQYGLMAFYIEFSNNTPELILTEHQKTAWLSVEELLELPMAESDRAILHALSENY